MVGNVKESFPVGTPQIQVLLVCLWEQYDQVLMLSAWPLEWPRPSPTKKAGLHLPVGYFDSLTYI